MITDRLLARLAVLLAPDVTATGAGTGVPTASEVLHHVVVEHGESMFRLALSITRDAALAEDVTQEALTKAWLALPTFRGDGSLRSWLLRITHNTAMSMLRGRRTDAVDPADMIDLSSGGRHVDDAVTDRAAVAAFRDALDDMDEVSRQIVVLREVEGLAYEDIAAILGVPLPTVKTRLLRARRRLVHVLEPWR